MRDREIDINIKQADNGPFVLNWTEWKESEEDDGIMIPSERRLHVADTFEDALNEVGNIMVKRFPGMESDIDEG